MKQKASKPQKARGKKNLLGLAAAVVAVAAIAITLVPKLLPQKVKAAEEDVTKIVQGEDVVIDIAALTNTASFFSYDADGTAVELFGIEASDGTTRLALNTCQICNGSPYAYFVQEEDAFVCQNCGNRFTSTQVGIVSGGCNPIPITETDYTVNNGSISIPSELLDGYADRFVNWKRF